MKVQGFCPNCGFESLFLGKDGHVTCGVLGECSDPCAADKILGERETEHTVTFTAEGFTVKHPLRERINDALLSCDLHEFCASLPGPPVQPGTYRAARRDGAWWFRRVPDPRTAESTSPREMEA